MLHHLLGQTVPRGLNVYSLLIYMLYALHRTSFFKMLNKYDPLINTHRHISTYAYTHAFPRHACMYRKYMHVQRH